MTKKTILTIICMYCKTKIGEKDGRGVEGDTHSICRECREKLFPNFPYLEERKSKPIVVCLCGSTRFVDTFNEWRKKLTLDGKIVLSIELVTSQSMIEDPQHNNHKVKKMLDELHLRKIDLADEVMILNVGGYIGESTNRELEYAKSLGKAIVFLEN